MAIITDVVNAPLAQMVEQLTLNQWAQGSSPWRCTNQKEALRESRSAFCFDCIYPYWKSSSKNSLKSSKVSSEDTIVVVLFCSQIGTIGF